MLVSIDKTLAQPPRGTIRILGTLRRQANVLEIGEQVGVLEVQCAGPTGVYMSRHSKFQLPSMGKYIRE